MNEVRAAYWKDIQEMLKRFEAMEGKARTQDAMNNLACSIARALSSMLKLPKEGAARPGEASKRAAHARLSKDWSRAKLTAKWNGVCLVCGEKGTVGELVRYGKGRPSPMVHDRCVTVQEKQGCLY